MFRITTDTEYLDVPASTAASAWHMVRGVRPAAGLPRSVDVLPDDMDSALYTEDRVAHWTHPGETGEIVETEAPRNGPRFHWVQWPSGRDSVAFYPSALIRVTPLENGS